MTCRLLACLTAISLLWTGMPAEAAAPVKKAPARAPIKAAARPVAKRPAAKPVAKAPVKKPIAKAPVKPATPVDPQQFRKDHEAGIEALQADQYAQAATLLQRALTMDEKIPQHGPRHKNIAIIATALGEAHFRQNHFDQALQAYKKALGVLDLPGNNDTQSVAHALNRIGLIHMYQGRYTEAKPVYERLLAMLEGPSGPDIPEADKQAKDVRDQLRDISRAGSAPDYLESLLGREGRESHRWSDATQPVNIYIRDGSGMPGWGPEYRQAVQTAYQTWEKALNNQLHFAFVDDPTVADSFVGWEERPTRHGGDDAPKENGYCDLLMDQTHHLFIHNNISVALNNSEGRPVTPTLVQGVLLHEIGHSIGLPHSPDPADIMYESTRYEHSELHKLSARDINTAKLLYAKPPESTNPSGIRLAAFSHFHDVLKVAREAYNQKDYETAYEHFRKSLDLYDDTDARYFAGISAYKLKRYEEALPYFLVVARRPGENQGEAIALGGSSMLQLAQQKEQSGQTHAAEEQYGVAGKFMNDALQTSNLPPEDISKIHEQLDWLNQRTTYVGKNLIYWSNGTPVDTGKAETETAEKPKKKRRFRLDPGEAPSQIIINHQPGGF